MSEAWRDDFPVDWEQDHYVARRDFVKFMVLTSLGLAVGQVAIGLDAVMRTPKVGGEKFLVELDRLPVGQSLPFTYPTESDPCLLVRLDEQTLVAYGQKCTHLSCAVVPQPERGRFYCPCHEGAFDIRDGHPIQGPPRRPLPQVKLKIQDGKVYAVG